MTNSDLSLSAAGEHNDPEALEEGVFIRSHLQEANLRSLQALAFKLMYGKSEKVSDLQWEFDKRKELVEMIALIIGKTYVERGDSYVLPDDEALVMIRDLLLQYHPWVVDRNKNKQIPKDLFM
jgi:hypothetical protein